MHANSDHWLLLTFEFFELEVYFRVINMLIWYKTSIICPELHDLAKMASLAKIRQVFAKTPL